MRLDLVKSESKYIGVTFSSYLFSIFGEIFSNYCVIKDGKLPEKFRASTTIAMSRHEDELCNNSGVCLFEIESKDGKYDFKRNNDV